MILLNPFTLGAAVYVLIKFAPSGTFQPLFVSPDLRILYLFPVHFNPRPCGTELDHPLYHTHYHHPYGKNQAKIQALFKYSRRIILPSVGLVLACRIILMDSNEISRVFGYNGKKEKYEFIETVAKDLPVVFLGSYQPPSLYHFFTGKEGMVISSLYSRQTQFDIWQFEKKYHNKRVFVSSVEDKRSRIYQKGLR